MRMLRLLLLGLACASAGACAVRDATGPGIVAPMAGTWRYTAAEVAPTTAQMQGTLTLDVASDGSISGTAQVVESVPGSSDRALAGQVSGQAIAAGTVELTLTVGGVVRQHVGALRADTLAGTWVVTDGAAAGMSGSFAAIRTGP
jgi:hypothetical protein